jgi:hypothetical protein
MANRNRTRRSVKPRKQSMRQRRRHGGAAVPSLGLAAGLDAAYKPLEGSSLQQGQQFQELTKQFHGGAADYPAALSGAPLIDSSMTDAARTTVLDSALGEIKGMSDMAGGRRGRKGRKASRKTSRSAHRKGRKATRKGRKATRKGRKASRKASRKNRQRQRQSQRQRQRQRQSQRQRQRQGGGALALNPADYSKGGDFMLGIDSQAAGLNKEWADVAAAGGGDYMAPRVQEVYRDDIPRL